MKSVFDALADLAYIDKYRHQDDDRNRDFGKAVVEQWRTMILTDEDGALGETSQIMVERAMRAFNRRGKPRTLEQKAEKKGAAG